MIDRVKGGWIVKSRKGKNLGGPYKNKAEAHHRLGVVEWYKKRKKG